MLQQCCVSHAFCDLLFMLTIAEQTRHFIPQNLMLVYKSVCTSIDEDFVFVRMRSRVMRLVKSVCVRTYVRMYVHIYICRQKNRRFSALPLENLLLSVIYCLLFKFKRLQCGLLLPASYTDKRFTPF